MNRYTFMELDGALAERLNEILLELPKRRYLRLTTKAVKGVH